MFFFAFGRSPTGPRHHNYFIGRMCGLLTPRDPHFYSYVFGALLSVYEMLTMLIPGPGYFQNLRLAGVIHDEISEKSATCSMTCEITCSFVLSSVTGCP